MILRRFMLHIKEQNWFAVGLDITVVIVGIFLGMQVTNWNDTRIENETAKVYIERLKEDLVGNKKDLEERIVYFTTVRQYAHRALKSLDEQQSNLDKNFIIDIYQARHILARELGRDTYDEILSVGALNTESTIEVRKRLAVYYRSIAAQVDNLDRRLPYRDIVIKTIPYKVQQLINASCNDKITTEASGEPSIVLPPTCNIDIPQALVDESVNAISYADIKPELSSKTTHLDSIIASMKLILNRIALLENDLNHWQKTI